MNESDGGSTPDGSGADVVVSSSPGIACGEKTCTAGAETCCVEKASRTCQTSSSGTCSGQVFRIQCDDTADCASGVCCFTNVLQSAEVAMMCLPSCSSASIIQMCKRTSDCTNGGPCNTYTCGGTFGLGMITLGLCTSSPPAVCQ